jgi:hypothetical protein
MDDMEVVTTDYVMVPVPKQHVQGVMAYLVRRFKDAPKEELIAWDQEAIDRLFLEANEMTRGMLSFLAHPSRVGKEFQPVDIAKALEVAVSDVAGLLGPLMRSIKKDGRQSLFESRMVSHVAASGRTTRRSSLSMHDAIASMIRSAEKTAAELEPHPLLNPDAGA